MKKIKKLAASILFFVLPILGQSQNSALEKKVTLHFTSSSTEDILKSISEQTGAKFQFNNNIDPNKKINIQLTNITVKEALDYLFKGSESKYTEFQNQIS